MLIIIALIILTILGFFIAWLDNKYWHIDAGICCGGILGGLGIVGTLIAICMLIAYLCNAPSTQAAYEEQYTKLLSKVAHIDSYNCEEIAAQVDDWNYNYRQNAYGKASPWVGAFYTIDTSTTDLIKLDGGIESNE